jgi:hypothetical protein
MYGTPSTLQGPPQPGGNFNLSMQSQAQPQARNRQHTNRGRPTTVPYPSHPHNGHHQLRGSGAMRGTPSTLQGPSQPRGSPNLSILLQAQPQTRNRQHPSHTRPPNAPIPTVLRSVDHWRREANNRRAREADNLGMQMNRSSHPSRPEIQASQQAPHTHANPPASLPQLSYPARFITNPNTGMRDAIVTVSVDPPRERHVFSRRPDIFEPSFLNQGAQGFPSVLARNSQFQQPAQQLHPNGLGGILPPGANPSAQQMPRSSRFVNPRAVDPVLGNLDPEERSQAGWSPIMARRDLPTGPTGIERAPNHTALPLAQHSFTDDL